MSMYIMTDGQSNKFWVVDVLGPDETRIKHGEMDLKVNVVSFARTMDDAKVKVFKEQLKK